MNSDKSLNIEIYFIKRVVWAALIITTILALVELTVNNFIFSFNSLIDVGVFEGLILALILKYYGRYKLAGAISSLIILLLMVMELFLSDIVRPGSLAVILVLGFFNSVFFRNRLRLILHLFSFISLIVVFAHFFSIKDLSQEGYLVTTAINIILLYSIVAYAAIKLKDNYVDSLETLDKKNASLAVARNEIYQQKEELLLSNEQLNALNLQLEELVNEKSEIIDLQNEQLIKHAHAHAHELRAPLARIAGLLHLNEIDSKSDKKYIFRCIQNELKDLEVKVKEITDGLNNVV